MKFSELYPDALPGRYNSPEPDLVYDFSEVPCVECKDLTKWKWANIWYLCSEECLIKFLGFAEDEQHWLNFLDKDIKESPEKLKSADEAFSDKINRLLGDNKEIDLDEPIDGDVDL